MRRLSLSRRVELSAVLAVLASSAVAFVFTHLTGSNRQPVVDWIATSWPTLLALSAGLHLLETGPAASWPPLVLRLSALLRYAMLLFAFIVLVPRLGLARGAAGGLILVCAVSFWLFAMLKLFWPQQAPSFPLLSLFSFLGGRHSSAPFPPPGTSSMKDGLQTKPPRLRFSDVGGQETTKQQIRN